MSKLDANKDGKVTWDEFLAALMEWLQEDEKDQGRALPGRKRKDAPLSPALTRSKIHKRISQFFLQFKHAENFLSIRENIAAVLAKHPGEDALVYYSVGPGDATQTIDPSKKAQVLAETQVLLDKLPQLVLGINSNDRNVAFQSVKEIAQLLSICDIFRTPLVSCLFLLILGVSWNGLGFVQFHAHLLGGPDSLTMFNNLVVLCGVT